VPTDITSAEDCARLAAAAKSELGRVDILVNNAFSDGNFKSFEDSDLAEWRNTFDVNFWGTLQLTKAALPYLKEQDDSRIIMINTMSVQDIEPTFGAYAASKAALATATKTLATELGRDGVRVNGIHPGYIWGRSVEWYLNHLAEENGTSFDEEYARVADQTCLGYIPPSAEIAGAVVFFASPLSKPITGQSLSVNGGAWLH
jgi:NAD(P)-dependent dehydrogenase (short-subunit alcohol dehydrogenase family)